MPDREPISFERIADRTYPSAPRISPDGTSVAVTVAHFSDTDDRARSSIWMIRNDGEPFRFTGGLAGASSPDWSPDGTRIVFVSKRDDKDEQAGLFVISANGGEAQQLGDVRGEISNPRWSPDGSRIAFLMPDLETEEEKKEKEAKKDHIVVDEDPKHGRLWIIDAETGSKRQLTSGSRSVHNYAWGPDGDDLVVISTPTPALTSLYCPTRVGHVPVHGGLETEITTFPMSPSTPVVREVNGERVVALVANDHRSDPSPSIWTVAWNGGSRHNALPDLHGVVSDIVPDPKHPDRVLAVIVEGTHGRLYSVSIETGEREALTPSEFEDRGSIDAGVSVSQDGNTIACVWAATDRTDNVWTVTRGKSATKRTSFGGDFEDELARGETVRWQSFDGVKIEGTLIRPRGADAGQPLPLFIQIHGGPAWQWEDTINLSWHDWAQMLASRGWAVLLPNPRGSTGYGSAFEKLLQDDVGGGESKDLVAAAEAMVERGIADPDRLAIGGWSWGGYLTARTITQTNRFKAAVMGAGVANLTSDHGAGDIPDYNTLLYPGHPYDEETWDYYAAGTPIRQASKVETPTLIVHGDADARVHPTQGQEYYHALRHNNVPVQFVRYPREEHSFKEREHQLDLMNRICTWLEKWVPIT